MIKLTRIAANEVARIFEELNLPIIDTSIRVGMKAGGCSGFDVIMDCDQDKPNKNDLTFQSNGVTIVVDKKSHLYLDGMEINYERVGMESGFRFYPPNATAKCGCGTSFAFAPPVTSDQTPSLQF